MSIALYQTLFSLITRVEGHESNNMHKIPDHDFLRNSESVSLLFRASSSMVSMPLSFRAFYTTLVILKYKRLKRSLTFKQYLYLENSSSQSFDDVLPRRYSVLSVIILTLSREDMHTLAIPLEKTGVISPGG